MKSPKEEYEEKKRDLLEKFSPEFKQKYEHQMTANKVFYALLNDVSVYDILENLCDSHEELFDILKRKIALDPPQPIFISKERYEEIKKRL